MDNKPSTGVSVGGASLLMLFAVLCMTVFAVLSFVTANSERKLAQKSADAVTAYYAADSAACEILNTLAAGTPVAGVDPVENLWGTFYEFTVDIDAQQALLVRASDDGSGALRVECWRVITTGDWTADSGQDVWLGE